MQIDRWDYAGMADLLATSPDLQDAMLRVAEDGAEIIRPYAPVGEPPDDTHPGNYRDLIHATPGKGPLGDRVGARIVAGADYSAAHEFGNKHVPASGFLASMIDVLTGG